MSKKTIAIALFRLKRTGEEIINVAGQLFSADELLTMYLGRKVSAAQGQEFIRK